MTSSGDDTEPRTSGRRWASWALVAVAGATDAIGFILFAGLYVSFMSGDATQSGVHLGRGQWSPLVSVLGAQALFVLGAAIGQLVQVTFKMWRRSVLLGGITVLLLLAAATGRPVPVVAFIAAVVAMGALNGVMHQEAGVPVGTMITGTLVRLGQGIVEALQGRPGAIRDNLGQWVFFCAGAAAGAVAYSAGGPFAFALPALASAVLFLVFVLRRELTQTVGAGVSG